MVLAGLLGLCIGSFLNVVIHRLPIMMEQEWRGQCAELNGEKTQIDTEAKALDGQRASLDENTFQQRGLALQHFEHPVRHQPVSAAALIGGLAHIR